MPPFTMGTLRSLEDGGRFLTEPVDREWARLPLLYRLLEKGVHKLLHATTRTDDGVDAYELRAYARPPVAPSAVCR